MNVLWNSALTEHLLKVNLHIHNTLTISILVVLEKLKLSVVPNLVS